MENDEFLKTTGSWVYNSEDRLSGKVDLYRDIVVSPDKNDPFKCAHYYNYLMNQARQVFYNNFIDSVDQGRLFRATKRLLARTDELSFPDYHNKTALANDINDFYVRKQGEAKMR